LTVGKSDIDIGTKKTKTSFALPCSTSRDRGYNIKKFTPKDWRKMAFLTQNKANLCKKLITTLGFEIGEKWRF
jgi:hypothetical protein